MEDIKVKELNIDSKGGFEYTQGKRDKSYFKTVLKEVTLNQIKQDHPIIVNAPSLYCNEIDTISFVDINTYLSTLYFRFEVWNKKENTIRDEKIILIFPYKQNFEKEIKGIVEFFIKGSEKIKKSESEKYFFSIINIKIS